MAAQGICLAIGICSVASSALAHDCWLTVSNDTTSVGDKIKVQICKGHSFPKSSHGDHGPSLPTLTTRMPDGSDQVASITTNSSGSEAMIECKKEGLYLLAASLKKNANAEPHYWARTIVAVGDLSNKQLACPKMKRGLEIVTGDNFLHVAPGDTLRLSATYDGKPIRALLTITRKKGKTSHVRTSARRPANLTIDAPGQYLVIASITGMKCSLTFTVSQQSQE